MPSRRIAGFCVAPLLVMFLVACGDTAVPPGQEVLAEVAEGTPRDDVMALLPEGELEEQAQTFRGYRMNRYLAGGGTVEVVWLHREGSAGEAAEVRRDLNPVIFRDGALDGWGWDHFDRRAEEWDLPSPPGEESEES